MGNAVVEQVTANLAEGGIRAGYAWPGRKMPQLTGPAAAVCLEKVDDAKRETTVLVTVCSPGDQGGNACETVALAAMAVLQESGAVCLLEGCRYDGQLNLFFMDLHAVFAEPEEEPEEEKLPASVKMGLAPLPYMTGFKSWHLTDDPATTPLSSSLCYFRLEELIPVGEVEQNTPAEPFNITVTRGGTIETFTGCRLTSDVREDRMNGVSRVRSGTAEKKTFVSIL